MKIEIKDRANYVQYFKAVLKNYIEVVENTNRAVKGYKKNLLTKIKDGDFSYHALKHNLKEDRNVSDLVNMLFKNPDVKKFYSVERVQDIIFAFFAKQIKETKGLELDGGDFEKIKLGVLRHISNVGVRKYAFQIEYAKARLEKQNFGCCEIVKWDFKKTPVYASKLFNATVPNSNPKFRTFIIVKLNGNDSKIDYPRALKLAANFVGLLKLQNPKSPKLSLGGTYFSFLKGKWHAAYESREVTHWDLDISVNKLEKQIKPFKKYLKKLSSNENNDLYDSFANSLTRFSYAMTIKQPSFKIAEMMGSIETIFTKREEARNSDLNLVDVIYKRIIGLVGKESDPEWLYEILENYYDKRSSYYHQSDPEELKKGEENLRWIYLVVFVESMKSIDKLNSKKEFLKCLDERYEKLVQANTSSNKAIKAC